MTNSLDPRSPREYRRRARVIVAYGLSGAIIGTAGLIHRELLGTASVAQALDGPIDELWLAVYALSGLAAAVGVIALRPELEVRGLWFMLAAALINAAAVFANRGPIGGGITSSSLLLAAWVIHSRIGDLHAAARADRRVIDLGPELRREQPDGPRRG